MITVLLVDGGSDIGWVRGWVVWDSRELDHNKSDTKGYSLERWFGEDAGCSKGVG